MGKQFNFDKIIKYKQNICSKEISYPIIGYKHYFGPTNLGQFESHKKCRSQNCLVKKNVGHTIVGQKNWVQ